jgi:putative ABC transport system permease protein
MRPPPSTQRRVPLARRNLFEDRRRAAIAVTGLAAALMLVLVLDGIFTGAMRQVTAYIDASPADVFVAQSDVRTMHMSVSALADDTVALVQQVPGVRWAEPLRYTTATVAHRDATALTYVIGYDTRTGRGGPTEVATGRAPSTGEVLIDQAAADDLGVRIGDTVEVLGRSWRVSGLSTRGTNIVNTSVFVNLDDFAAIRGPGVNYVIVDPEQGTAAATLARRINETVPGVTAQTRAQFSAEESRIVRDMATDLMRMMTFVALLIALAVIALTLFTVTLAKLPEYGVIKALGASGGRLAATVAAQAAWSTALAIVLAVVLSVGIGAALGRFTTNLSVVISAAAVGRTAALAFAVGALAAVVPLRQVLSVDPSTAFRRRR